MVRARVALSWLLLAALLAPLPAYAHPHVFIDVVDTVVLRKGALEGVRQEWRLQGSFSLDLLSNYDKDGDGAFSDTEQVAVYGTTFLPLWYDARLFRVRIAGVEYAARQVRDFRAVVDRGEVRFEYFVPCDIRYNGDGLQADLITYDENNYISFDLYDCRVEGERCGDCAVGFRSDESIASHGLDRHGTWASLSLPDASAGCSKDASGSTVGPNLAATSSSGQAQSVNPFTGVP